jgi:poly(3-hydroxybutyrate) depolymerase
MARFPETHMTRPLIVLAALGLFAPALVAQSGARPGSATAAHIQKKTYEFKDAGKDMEYAVFVPTKYDKAKKTPLVVALHGLGSNAQQMIRYPGLTDLAEKYGYIVVAPMGYNAGGWYGIKFPFGKPNPENLYELSEKDVMNVLDIARKDYTVDPDRIYLMGHSMGGGGTFHLGSKYPDTWAALAPIAPALFEPVTELEKARKLPVVLVQGDADLLCPVSRARQWAAEMKKLEMDYRYVEIHRGDHISVAFNNLPEVFAFFDLHKRTPAAK